MNDQRSSIGFNLDHVRPRGHYENVTYEAEAPEKAAKLKAIIAQLEALDPDIEIPESWQDDIKRWGGGTFREYVSDLLPLPRFEDLDHTKPVVWDDFTQGAPLPEGVIGINADTGEFVFRKDIPN